MATARERFSSRKFVMASLSYIAATFALVWGVTICKDAQDIAIVVAAWGVVDGAILKLYNDANLKAANGGDE